VLAQDIAISKLVTFRDGRSVGSGRREFPPVGIAARRKRRACRLKIAGDQASGMTAAPRRALPVPALNNCWPAASYVYAG
jgi:hypothetical protein